MLGIKRKRFKRIPKKKFPFSKKDHDGYMYSVILTFFLHKNFRKQELVKMMDVYNYSSWPGLKGVSKQITVDRLIHEYLEKGFLLSSIVLGDTYYCVNPDHLKKGGVWYIPKAKSRTSHSVQS